MPKGDFRKSWLKAAQEERLPKRLLMRIVANNDDLMTRMEAAAIAEADKKGLKGSWDSILAVLLPILFKLLEQWINKK
jgi:hypothetical protein